MSTPVLDTRTAEQFFADAVALARAYCPDWTGNWPPKITDITNAVVAQDPGLVLIRLFSLLAKYLADIENALPNQRQLALYKFLELKLRTAEPALVPLSFQLASRSGPQTVPMGEAVLDQATQTIRFETDADLLVVPANVCAALAVQPLLDRYVDALACWNRATPAPIFLGDRWSIGDEPLVHCLMLGDPVLFKPDPAVQQIVVTLTGENLKREYFGRCFDASVQTTLQATSVSAPDETTCTITVTQMPQAAPVNAVEVHRLLCASVGRGIDVADVDAGPDGATTTMLSWLLVQPDAQTRIVPELARGYLPEIDTVDCVFSGGNIPPQQAACNGTLIDISNGAYPFGTTPAQDSAFYLRCDSVFSKCGANVTLTFTLRQLSTVYQVTLDWQGWNGSSWQLIDGVVDNTNSLQRNQHNAADTTITFKCPSWISQQTVAGNKGYWIRAVISSGDSYGTQGSVVPQPVATTINGIPDQYLSESQKPPLIQYLNNTAVNFSYKIDKSQYEPPYVRAVVISYTYAASPAASCSWRHNAFELSRCELTAYKPYSAQAVDESATCNALYVGFASDPSLPGNPLTLYFNLPDSPQESAAATNQLQWEAFGATDPVSVASWLKLGADDTSQSLMRSGIVTLQLPEGLQATTLFSQHAYWLRLLNASTAVYLSADGLYPNTVMAKNLTTYEDEVLGSSNGQPGQTFLLRHSGVQSGQAAQPATGQLVGQAPQRNVGAQPDLDLQVIEPASFDDGVGPDASGDDVMRAWTRVDSFVSYGPQDRVYTLDGLSGRITFGDGRYGMIPPIGRNNVIVDRYETTQGKVGNVPANSLSLLRPGIAGIASVTNPVAAWGGVDGDLVEDIVLRGPALLRANDRAVSLEDLETLAAAASPRVWRARAIERRMTEASVGGDALSFPRIDLVVLLTSTGPQPCAPDSLLDEVRAYVCASCLAPLAPRIRMQRAAFALVDVDVCLRTKAPPDQWNALSRGVEQSLASFLQPVIGGPLGKGWPFGAMPGQAAAVTFLLGLTDVGITAVSKIAVSRKDPPPAGPLVSSNEVPAAGTITVQFEEAD